MSKTTGPSCPRNPPPPTPLRSRAPPKMPPKGSTKLSAPRLPPLPKLRVRRPNKPETNPCLALMTSVLSTQAPPPHSAHEEYTTAVSLMARLRAGCWASSGFSVQGCSGLEQQLRACMDTPVRRLRAICHSLGDGHGIEGGRSLWHERDADGCCRCRGRRIRRRIRSITISPGYILRSRGRRNGNESWAKKENRTGAWAICVQIVYLRGFFFEGEGCVRWRIDRAG